MAEMTIRRFGIFSVAKMQSLVMFVIGLIVGVIYGLFFMLFGAAISAFGARGEGSAVGGVPSIIVGILFMIGAPIFYAILGFIGGAIGALVYNLAAAMVAKPVSRSVIENPTNGRSCERKGIDISHRLTLMTQIKRDRN